MLDECVGEVCCFIKLSVAHFTFQCILSINFSLKETNFAVSLLCLGDAFLKEELFLCILGFLVRLCCVNCGVLL